MGHRITAGFYKAKITEVRGDYLILVTEFKHATGKMEKEIAKQFIPLSRVKRITVMKSERVLHL